MLVSRLEAFIPISEKSTSFEKKDINFSMFVEM